MLCGFAAFFYLLPSTCDDISTLKLIRFRAFIYRLRGAIRSRTHQSMEQSAPRPRNSHRHCRHRAGMPYLVAPWPRAVCRRVDSAFRRPWRRRQQARFLPRSGLFSRRANLDCKGTQRRAVRLIEEISNAQLALTATTLTDAI